MPRSAAQRRDLGAPMAHATARGSRGVCTQASPALDRGRQQRRRSFRAQSTPAARVAGARRLHSKTPTRRWRVRRSERRMPRPCSTKSRAPTSPRSPTRAGSTSGNGSICRNRAGAQALVAWLRGALGAPPPASLIERLMREATVTGHRRWPLDGAELRSYRGRLHVAVPAARDLDPAPLSVDLSRPGLHGIAPWRGSFRVEAVERGGIAVADAKRLELAPRAPRDRFQAGARRPARSLKLQYQSLGVDRRCAPARSSVAKTCRRSCRAGRRRARACRRWRSTGRTRLGAGPALSATGAARALARIAILCAARRRAFARPQPRRRIPMALIVHKYGGTSMGSPERIQSVAERVAKWVRAGHQLVVVPSAMSGETNRLLGARAQGALAGATTPAMLRELDMIAATGEQVSVGLLAIALHAEGARSGQLCRLAGADRDRRRLHQGAHPADRRRAHPRRPRRRQGRRHHRLPGRRSATATSRRSAAAAPTPRRWRSPRRSRPTSA